MEHFIIGTAGHVDHGKTALIRALTGRETDNLKEEKERGISIDLGFTYMELSDGSRAGIIDVPGHEKFLTNMAAGVCGMDLVLLVIALDEGIMPQTEEHLEIISLLGVVRGIIVLTKSDLVEEQWADMMEEEIRAELPDICRGWETLRVSAKNGQGIDKLKHTIEKDHDGLDILMMFIRRDNSYINIGNQSIIRRLERQGEHKLIEFAAVAANGLHTGTGRGNGEYTAVGDRAYVECFYC